MSSQKIALTLSIVCTLLFASFLMHTFKQRFNFDNLSSDEKKLVLFSENAFYYSFYQDVIQAPDLKAISTKLTVTNRIQSPQTINPFLSFNITQETILGLTYKLVHSFVPQLDPLNFYLGAIFILNATLAGLIFWIAYNHTQSVIISTISPLLLAITVPYSTRIVFAPSLRENFALPFLILLVYLLTLYRHQPSPKKMLTILLLALANLILWQFSLFTLLPIFLIYLSLNHKYFLTPKNIPYLVLIIVPILVIFLGNSFGHVTNFVAGRIAHQPLTFETLMYACEESFNPINGYALTNLIKKLILPLFLISVGYQGLQILSQKRATNQQFPELFIHLISLVFFVYSINSYRFLSLFIPFAAISAVYIFSHIAPQTRNLILIPVLGYLLFTIFTNPPPKGYPNFTNDLDLVHWINSNTDQNSVISATMATNSLVKLMTSRPITNHPQFENIYNRNTTRNLYLAYTRSPQELIYSKISSLQTDYLILDNANCYYRTSMGCTQEDLYQNQGYGFPEMTSFCALDTYNPKLFALTYQNPDYKVLKLIK